MLGIVESCLHVLQVCEVEDSGFGLGMYLSPTTPHPESRGTDGQGCLVFGAWDSFQKFPQPPQTSKHLEFT